MAVIVAMHIAIAIGVPVIMVVAMAVAVTLCEAVTHCFFNWCNIDNMQVQ